MKLKIVTMDSMKFVLDSCETDVYPGDRIAVVKDDDLDVNHMQSLKEALAKHLGTDRVLVLGVGTDVTVEFRTVEEKAYNRTCGKCGQPAYLGFSSAECSTPGCRP